MPSSYPNDTKTSKKLSSRVGNAIMKSYRFHVPKYDLPLRLRPWFLAFTCAVMVLLAFLGFTDFSRALPLNDKLLHFLCFMVATGVFYFIVDIEESARRVWFWRYFNLLFTAFVCFLCGGILSEVVQSLLPYKEFQVGDVVANILGSSIGLASSYHLEKHYRYRREISRLYRPLESESLSDFEDDLETFGTQLLPTHHSHSQHDDGSSTTRSARPFGVGGGGGGEGKNKKKGNVRFANVWNDERGEREELFDIGEESEDEDEVGMGGGGGRETDGRAHEQHKQAVLTSSA